MSTALELRGVSVTVGRDRVLSGVDARVERGEWVAVIGPNGAGKTTLLRTIAGTVAFSGEVRVNDAPVGRFTRRQLARQIALVPQRPVIPPDLTVAEYVLLGRTPYIGYFSTETRLDRLAAERAIMRLRLRQLTDRRLGSLSGGELQRAVLARALAQEAPIQLLDEPTSALDLGRQQEALELIDWLRREAGLTVVSAMHDLNLAGQYADRLLLLDRGSLVAEGSPAAVLLEQSIAAHYGARIRVVQEDGALHVLPLREGSRWAP